MSYFEPIFLHLPLFITNHFCRIITQFTSTYPVSLIKVNPSTSTDDQQRASSINNQIEIVIPFLLSGFITKGVSEIQQQYMDRLRLPRLPNIKSKSAIHLLLEFLQALWKFRSDILHKEATFTQEAMLRSQAIHLFQSPKIVPEPSRVIYLLSPNNPTTKCDFMDEKNKSCVRLFF